MTHTPNNPNDIGLNMIVKNESHVIEALLRSVAPYISTWTIVDTGSTDDTPAIINRVMDELGIKGKLHHKPWVDFGTNRSQALELAKGTARYHWVIDADDLIVGDFQIPKLDLASYYLLYGRGFTYKRQQLFRDDLSWKYIGVLHEYPSCGKQLDIGSIEGGYHIESRRLGARNQNPRKYLDDAEVLKKGLEKEPDNARYWFYLGQSYYDGHSFGQAKEAYQKRASMEGWVEETFYAKFRVGVCLEEMNAPLEEIMAAHLEAFRFRPIRAEPLHRLAVLLREKKEYGLAALFAWQAMVMPCPADILFVDADVYRFKAKDEFSVAAFYTQNPIQRLEGYKVCLELIRRQDIPASVSERAANNLTWYDKKYPNFAGLV